MFKSFCFFSTLSVFFADIHRVKFLKPTKNLMENPVKSHYS